MLRGIDTTLELVGWSLAVFFVILLFAGPRVVAEDKPEAAPAAAQGSAPANAQDSAPAVDGKTVFTQTPEKFAASVPDLVEAGACFLGGCCGTTPEFIRAVKEALTP